MRTRFLAAAALAAVLLGATRHTTPMTVYSSPAGMQAAGIYGGRATLPDGRIVVPLGASVSVGTKPQGVALSPDGRFAVVSNGAPAFSLTVVDAQRLHIVGTFSDPNDAFSAGLAVVRDPRNPAQTLVLASDGPHDVVRTFDLGSAGGITADQAIVLPHADAPGYAGNGRAFPSAIAVSPDGRFAYVAETFGQIVADVDIASRSASGGIAVGFRPWAVAATNGAVYALDAGLSLYQTLSPARRMPAFGAPALDEDRSSSLAVVPLGAGSGTDPAAVHYLRMDSGPDGVHDVGGIIPAAIVERPDGRYAYAALSNVDRIATIDLSGEPRVVAGLDLRLFPNAPYGTEPSAEVLSNDGSRLYVALAGLNAIAILDARNPAHLHRLGLIPTAWLPSALALSRDGRFLFVADAGGLGDGTGTLQRIDLRHLKPGPATLAALRYNRYASYARPNSVVPPLRSRVRSNVIRHVVYVSLGIENDATPNLQALSKEFAVANNFYAPTDESVALQLATAAGATLPVERDAGLGALREPFLGIGRDPEDYPRSGFIFNALARAGESFRDYGALEDVSGYQNGLYGLDVPVLAVLDGNVDLAYSPAIAVTDRMRAAEFDRDFNALAKDDKVPDFTFVDLPATASGELDADRALGDIMQTITSEPQWNATAVFVVPNRAASLAANGGRTYAVIVSPYARHGFADGAHLTIPGVVKTEEEILGLEPLGMDDLLATDLAPFFGSAADATPFEASSP